MSTIAAPRSFLPSGAAEFPNDNPALHDGVRWTCSTPLGAARALLRPRPTRAGIAPTEPRTEPAVAPAAAAPLEKDANPAPRSGGVDPVARALSLPGPLRLDLGRIVLLHRVEDVPPPPDFIYRPFVSSRRAAAGAAPVADAVDAVACSAGASPIVPSRCQVVDRWDVARRVRRGPGVDIAPCCSVDAVAPAPAASARVASLEQRRRASRRRSGVVARALAPSPLPRADEVSRAIRELEAAFAEPLEPSAERRPGLERHRPARELDRVGS